MHICTFAHLALILLGYILIVIDVHKISYAWNLFPKIKLNLSIVDDTNVRGESLMTKCFSFILGLSGDFLFLK